MCLQVRGNARAEAVLRLVVATTAETPCCCAMYAAAPVQVEKAAPAIDFSRAAPVERLELPQGKDEDEGNVLLLHPQLPVGYAGPDTSEPHKQPFHRHTERWQDSMRSTDGGNVLLLRTSADDVANPSGRIRFANAPGLIFGCANRFEVVEQPRDQGADIIGARALEMMKAAGKQRRRTAPAPTGQRIETALRQWGDGRDPLLDLIKAAPPGATIVQDIQRQDRVIRRMQAKFGEQDA